MTVMILGGLHCRRTIVCNTHHPPYSYACITSDMEYPYLTISYYLQTSDTNDALHYYSHDNVITKNGVLSIHVEQKVNLYKAFDENNKKFYADKKYIQSGMVQGWNKFCITGGIIEISAKLPGEPNIGGLWPALWLMGNLARATYVGSSDYMWPYSYSKCNLKRVHSQEINACMEVSHYGLESGKGRGAPEIDILETMQGIDDKLPHTNVTRPYLSASYQVRYNLCNFLDMQEIIEYLTCRVKCRLRQDFRRNDQFLVSYLRKATGTRILNMEMRQTQKSIPFFMV